MKDLVTWIFERSPGYFGLTSVGAFPLGAMMSYLCINVYVYLVFVYFCIWYLGILVSPRWEHFRWGRWCQVRRAQHRPGNVFPGKMTMMMTAIMMITMIVTITVTMVIISVVTRMMIGTMTMHSNSNHKNEEVSVKIKWLYKQFLKKKKPFF